MAGPVGSAARLGGGGAVGAALGAGPAGTQRHAARVLGRARLGRSRGARRGKLLAGAGGPRDRGRPRLPAGAAQRGRARGRAAARQHAPDAAQHPAPGRDPPRDPVVRDRRGGQDLPGGGRRAVPDLPQHLSRHPHRRPGPRRDGALLRALLGPAVPARDPAGRPALDPGGPALRARHHVAHAHRRRDDLGLLRHRLHDHERPRVPADGRGLLGILVYALLGKLADSATRLLERRLLAWHPAYALAATADVAGARP